MDRWRTEEKIWWYCQNCLSLSWAADYPESMDFYFLYAVFSNCNLWDMPEKHARLDYGLLKFYSDCVVRNMRPLPVGTATLSSMTRLTWRNGTLSLLLKLSRIRCVTQNKMEFSSSNLLHIMTNIAIMETLFYFLGKKCCETIPWIASREHPSLWSNGTGQEPHQ